MIDPTLAASAVATGLDLLRGEEEPAPAKANDAVDRTDFLTLLITQLQNQDPLNPLDSADFSAQLAQFSSLEQLTQINDKLGKLVATDDGSDGGDVLTLAPGALDLLALLGSEVRAAGSTTTLGGGVATPLAYRLEREAAVEAQILDARGDEVARVTLGPLAAGTHAFDLGALPEASTLADGTYTVLLTANDGAARTPLETTVSGRITGVDFSGESPVLLVGDTRLTLEDIREIREAPTNGS